VTHFAQSVLKSKFVEGPPEEQGPDAEQKHWEKEQLDKARMHVGTKDALEIARAKVSQHDEWF
jgi:hypothetical protein